jgi:phage terminase small subunit
VADMGDPIMPGGEPEPPPHLDAIAASVWRRLIAALASMGVIHDSDLFAFECLCGSIATCQGARQEMRTTSDPEARRVLQEEIIDLEKPIILDYAQRFFVAGGPAADVVWEETNR